MLAGIIMSIAIFKSKKAKTVVDTGVNLSSHEKDVKTHWKSNTFVNKLADLIVFIFKLLIIPIPKFIKKWIATRWERSHVPNNNKKAFDLLRAAVNLMVAAAVISFATSKKLPLSTTYVTFMVAMGTSLADGAWQKDCAAHRVAGVLTVISGWFITAIFAFLMAGITATILFHLKTGGLIALVAVVILLVRQLFKVHKKREEKKQDKLIITPEVS